MLLADNLESCKIAIVCHLRCALSNLAYNAERAAESLKIKRKTRFCAAFLYCLCNLLPLNPVYISEGSDIMKKMTSKELRKAWIDFYVERGHKDIGRVS